MRPAAGHAGMTRPHSAQPGSCHPAHPQPEGCGAAPPPPQGFLPLGFLCYTLPLKSRIQDITLMFTGWVSECTYKVRSKLPYKVFFFRLYITCVHTEQNLRLGRVWQEECGRRDSRGCFALTNIHLRQYGLYFHSSLHQW